MTNIFRDHLQRGIFEYFEDVREHPQMVILEKLWNCWHFWQLKPDNKEWHWTAFAILAMFLYHKMPPVWRQSWYFQQFRSLSLSTTNLPSCDPPVMLQSSPPVSSFVLQMLWTDDDDDDGGAISGRLWPLSAWAQTINKKEDGAGNSSRIWEFYAENGFFMGRDKMGNKLWINCEYLEIWIGQMIFSQR